MAVRHKWNPWKYEYHHDMKKHGHMKQIETHQMSRHESTFLPQPIAMRRALFSSGGANGQQGASAGTRFWVPQFCFFFLGGGGRGCGVLSFFLFFVGGGGWVGGSFEVVFYFSVFSSFFFAFFFLGGGGVKSRRFGFKPFLLAAQVDGSKKWQFP